VSLVVLEDIALRFAGRVIVDGLSLRIADADRIGLIGPNGSGKTTLLRIVAGDQAIDRGRIERRRGVRIGYLPQDLAVEGGRTLRDFVVSSVPGRAEVDSELAACQADLATAGDRGASEEEMIDLAGRIAELTERAVHFEQFFSEHEALRILAGLGFSDGDKDRDLGELSGGWKMRAVLAALLFQQPDLLLLDEPTNHLDMPSVAWFSDFLRRYRRAFVLISHDREFLDEEIARVVSFEPEGVRQYGGNYEQYARQRAEEAKVLENAAANVARERERLERLVDRFRAKASKARMAQSKQKALDKLEEVPVLATARRTMRMSFPPSARAGSEVARVDGVAKAYGDHVVFDSVDLSVRRGEKIAMIGPNGAGKTTLLKIMAGELAPDGGKVTTGSNVTVGYYAQHHADTLHKGWTVEEEVARANPDALPARVRGVLGAFLFSGDDVDKKVAVLSGGERARVALARLLIKPGNLLLMDEPTNHLDLESSEELAESLAGFDGTIVFVSHNRSLVRKLATRIWNVADRTVETYSGTLDEYMYSCRARLDESAEADSRSRVATSSPPRSPPGAAESAGRSREEERLRKRREAEERQKRAALIGPIASRIQSLEQRIGELEKAQAERGSALSDPAVYADEKRRRALLSEYQEAAAKIEELTHRWEAATEELEAAEARMAAEG